MALTGVMAFAFASSANASTLITNGDFEADPTGSGTISGWVVQETNPESVALLDGSSYIQCCNATGNPSNLANKFVSFGAGDSPTTTSDRISQSFFVNAPGVFNLRFDAAAIGVGGQSIGTGIFDFSAGVFRLVQFTEVLTPSSNFNSNFKTFSFNWTAQTAGEHALQFTAFGPTFSTDAFVDNVSVSAVPEPGTWAMMLLGFGFIGAAMRVGKRRAKASVSYA
jgi:hypothetical protein